MIAEHTIFSQLMFLVSILYEIIKKIKTISGISGTVFFN